MFPLCLVGMGSQFRRGPSLADARFSGRHQNPSLVYQNVVGSSTKLGHLPPAAFEFAFPSQQSHLPDGRILH